MDRRSFLSKLSKLKGQFIVDKNLQIRTIEQYQIVDNIATYPRIKNLCPLEALTLNKNKAYNFSYAADKLGIQPDLEELIIGAADQGNKIKREKLLRQRMLEVLGLKKKVKK